MDKFTMVMLEQVEWATAIDALEQYLIQKSVLLAQAKKESPWDSDLIQGIEATIKETKKTLETLRAEGRKAGW